MACMLWSIMVPGQSNAQRNAPTSREPWNDAGADSLIERATQRRSLQLADSTLLSYHADAHGFLAFLAQLGEGVIIPPKVVQSEELALTISWWQPESQCAAAGRTARHDIVARQCRLLPRPLRRDSRQLARSHSSG
ncbi:MAG: hypothetical protein IPP90_22995 [Gemmatimonadaceae bacterium]|nr:hypothetical protein [Gemmatimonadaceae bacterium]